MPDVGCPASVQFICLVPTACEIRDLPPIRHSNVPESAVWAGGVDGGSWIDCRFDDQGNVARCSIYDESTGELVAQGVFSSTDDEGAKAARKYEFGGYDGQRIFLSGDSALEPIECDVLPGGAPYPAKATSLGRP
jgi:hypothetical protein